VNVDDRDKAAADLFEAALKDVSINGVEGYIEPVMAAADYEPNIVGIAPTLPRDANRGTGLAIMNTLRLYPMRLANIGKAFLPPAGEWTGCLVFVPDASGGAVVAFSDGSSWKRCDTSATVT
jgi:hypothetical protein